MTRPLLLIALLLASCRPSMESVEVAEPEPTAFDPAVIKPELADFAGSLKGLLVETLDEEGPVAAISICKDKAPQKAEEFAGRTGWTIRRSALRLRNPANAPDDWEQGVLEDFEAKVAAGAAVETLAFGEFLPAAEGQTERYRFAKAIPVAGECVICHGSEVAEQIRESIAESYPEDRATGFAVGELRGIISVTVPLGE